MTNSGNIAEYYSPGNLLERLQLALIDDEVDPTKPTIDNLAPYDQFHGRGLEATKEIAALLKPNRSDLILDIGSGLGGPARYIANRFGCSIFGIDLTAEFCSVAKHLTELIGLDHNVIFEQGDALNTPFPDEKFDGAYSMNVSMNIENKDDFFNEIFRVLQPGASLVLSEIAKGNQGELDYPTAWAKSALSSFLITPQETEKKLSEVGFVEIKIRDVSFETLNYGARARAIIEEGKKPPHRAIQLVHGELGKEAAKNSSQAVSKGITIPIEISCKKPT